MRRRAIGASEQVARERNQDIMIIPTDLIKEYVNSPYLVNDPGLRMMYAYDKIAVSLMTWAIVCQLYAAVAFIKGCWLYGMGFFVSSMTGQYGADWIEINFMLYIPFSIALMRTAFLDRRFLNWQP